jgi:ABC-type multidrug transport system permease subunit
MSDDAPSSPLYYVIAPAINGVAARKPCLARYLLFEDVGVQPMDERSFSSAFLAVALALLLFYLLGRIVADALTDAVILALIALVIALFMSGGLRPLRFGSPRRRRH